MHLSELGMGELINLEEVGVTSFDSKGGIVSDIDTDLFPAKQDTRVMMMPFVVTDVENSIPRELGRFIPLIKNILKSTPEHIKHYDDCNVGYLTISEKEIHSGNSHRNSGLHIDGMLDGCLSGAWGGSGGGWGSTGNGMLICSNVSDLCKFYTGTFEGVPISREFDGVMKLDGDCEHLRSNLERSDIISHSQKAGEVLWADGMLVHESLIATKNISRTLVRISLPNNSPWFDSYTKNTLGILPSGVILSDKRF